MSDLDAVTMYRVVVAIEEYDIVNGIEKTPETISTIMAMKNCWNAVSQTCRRSMWGIWIWMR